MKMSLDEFLSPWAKMLLTGETMSVYFLFGLLTLLDLRVLVSFAPGQGAWELGPWKWHIAISRIIGLSLTT